MHVRTRTHTRTHARTHTHTHTHARAHTRTHAHTHTRTHARTHTHAQCRAAEKRCDSVYCVSRTPWLRSHCVGLPGLHNDAATQHTNTRNAARASHGMRSTCYTFAGITHHTLWASHINTSHITHHHTPHITHHHTSHIAGSTHHTSHTTHHTSHITHHTSHTPHTPHTTHTTHRGQHTSWGTATHAYADGRT
jgi:hypothetical protein